MAFVTIPNDKPISRHSPNFNWCKLADRKICMVYHTASNVAGALVFVQIANFDEDGNVSFETPIYVTTIPVACRFTFVDICAISETRICISYPVESAALKGDATVAGQSTQVASTLTPTACNLAFVDLTTGVVDKTMPVPFENAHYSSNPNSTSFRQNPPVLSFDGVSVVVQSSPTGWRTSNNGAGVGFLRLPKYKINPSSYEVNVVTYPAPYLTSQLNQDTVRQIQNYYTKNGVFISRASSVANPVQSVFSNFNINKDDVSTTRPNHTGANGTSPEYIYPLSDKYILFTKVGNSDNIKWFNYDHTEIGSLLLGSNYNLDSAIDAERTADGTFLVLNTTAPTYSYIGLAQVSNETVGSVQGSMYSLVQLNVFKIYPELNFINAPPPAIERQILNYVVRDIGQYSKRTIFPISDKAVALIGCFYPYDPVFTTAHFNLEKPGIITLKV